MKKVIVIVGIMLVVGFDIFGLDHGIITGFELGYNIYERSIAEGNYNKLGSDNDESLYIQLKTGYKIGNFRTVGTYTNTLLKRDLDSYIPIQDKFRIDINYTWNYITIGFFHWCDHPVITNRDYRSTLINSSQRAIYVSFYREF